MGRNGMGSTLSLSAEPFIWFGLRVKLFGFSQTCAPFVKILKSVQNGGFSIFPKMETKNVESSA